MVLDAVSGQVVIPANQTRQDVMNACQRGERAIEEMLDTWLERTPQDTREVLSMLELSCEEEETIEEENKENPYLIGEPKKPKQVDLAAEIKGSFEKLVSEGFDATAAAAKAIGMVAEEQKKGPKLEPGPLDGKAVRTGPLAMDNALDAAFAFAMERNPPTEVAVVLSTALKYLQNASKEPWSPKFRTFKLSNKVADKITRVDGGLRLLQSIGFEVFGTSQDFKATIPVASDLDNMNERIAHLLERLDEKK